MKESPNFLLISFILIIHVLTVSSQDTQRMYLSGKGSDDAVPWEFYCTGGQKSGVWTSIPVPSCWELQGFGNYNYGKDPVETIAAEQGLYRHSFMAPSGWKGRQVEIVFEGSMTDTEVKINGKSAGPMHQGAFYCFRYDISKLLLYGKENRLEVTVRKESSNPSVNRAERRADYWMFGGIFRPVYLEVKPTENIRRIAVDAKHDGSFRADVYYDGLKKATELELQLTDLWGNTVSPPQRFRILKNNEHTTLLTNFPGVESWNPEKPVLYRAVLSLLEGDRLIHRMEERIGFRTVEVKERDGIYVNGVKIRFKGVNRHSFWPVTGRTTNKALSIQDVELMKDMNMNAVRMSHYPPDGHFLDACDSLGLFVIDELGGWQQAYDTEIGKKLLKEMLIHDVNHPSILIWSNGNEAGWNTALDDEFAKHDPQQRIVIHPHASFGFTDTNHYPDYNLGTHESFNGSQVFFPTEFLHGLYDGGLGAGLEDFWDLMLSRPLCAGGFLWVFSDEAVSRTDLEGWLDSRGNLAPDGITGPYREKEGSFFTIKEIWSPVWIEDKLVTAEFDGKFRVENRYHYTSLSECSFSYELALFPTPLKGEAGHRTVYRGTLPSPDISPGDRGILKLDLPSDWKEAHVLYIRAEDRTGREIWTWDWPIILPADDPAGGMKIAGDGQAIAVDRDQSLTLEAPDIRVTIDKNTGRLQSIVAGNQTVSLSGGPRLPEGNAKQVANRHHQEGHAQVYEADFEGQQRKIRWTLHGNGILQLNYFYYPENNKPYYGLSFDYPDSLVNGVRWLGDGPYRVWKNRLKGTRLDVWEKAYNNSVTGESYEYPEFTGYYSGLYWARLNNTERPFTVYTCTENLYLKLYTPGKPANPMAGAYPEFPEGDLSFLQAISPIGTKFKKPENLGPQSQPNMHFRRNREEGVLEIELFFDFR